MTRPNLECVARPNFDFFSSALLIAILPDWMMPMWLCDSMSVCAPVCSDQTQPGLKWPSPIRTDGRSTTQYWLPARNVRTGGSCKIDL